MNRSWEGVLVGLSVAAPVGPMALLCLRRSIVLGGGIGLATGFGVASAHALYSALAVAGVHGVQTVLSDHAPVVHHVSGLVLVGLGARMVVRSRPNDRSDLRPLSAGAAYASAVALCLANPLTVVSLAGLLAGLRLASGSPGEDTALLVGGVFVGSSLWWLFVTCAAALLAARLSSRTVGWLNLTSGIGVVAMGASILGRG